MSLYYILNHRIRSPTELTVFLRKYLFLQTVDVSFIHIFIQLLPQAFTENSEYILQYKKIF